MEEPSDLEGSRRGSAGKILRSAFELFAERGYDGTTTKDIASAAGVNEVTIFRLFGNKEGLFRKAVLEMHPSRSVRSVVDLSGGGPVEEVLVRNSLKVLESLKSNRHAFMMMIGEVWRHPELKGDFGTENMDASVRFLAGQIQEMVDKGWLRVVDPFIAARSWIGLVQSHYIHYYLMGNGSIDPEEEERLLRGMTDIFLNGVGKGRIG